MGIGSQISQSLTPQQTTQPTAPQGNAPQPMGGKGVQQAVQPAPQPMGGKGAINQAVQPGQQTNVPSPVPGYNNYNDYMTAFTEQSKINSMTPGAPQISPMQPPGMPPGASDATTLKIPSAYSPQVTPMQPGMPPQQFGSPESIAQAKLMNQTAMANQAAFDPQNPQLSAIQRSMLGTQPVPQVLPARPPMQQPGPFAGPRPMFQQYLQGQGGLRALMERLRGGYGGMQQSPSQTFQDRYK